MHWRSSSHAALLLRLQNQPSVSPILIGFPAESGIALPLAVQWIRPQTQEKITAAEIRQLTRELSARTAELLRRRGPTPPVFSSALAETVTLDGHRVLNPIGFSGAQLHCAATVTALDAVAARFAEAVRSTAHHVHVQPMLLDMALARAANAASPADAVVLIEEMTTSVVAFRDGICAARSVFGIGREGFARHVRRSIPDASPGEIDRYLAGTLRHVSRRVELAAAASAAVRRWCRSLEGIIVPMLPPPAASQPWSFVLTGWRVPPPLAETRLPSIFSEPSLREGRWATMTSASALGLSARATPAEVAVAALDRVHGSSQLLLN